MSLPSVTNSGSDSGRKTRYRPSRRSWLKVWRRGAVAASRNQLSSENPYAAADESLGRAWEWGWQRWANGIWTRWWEKK